MRISIGQNQIDPPIFLAPMAGITDLPFRRVVSRFKTGHFLSEMIASQEMLSGRPGVRQKAELGLDTGNTSVQISGRDPYAISETAKLVEGMGAQIIDINMGCPAKKVCNKLAGSALMKDEGLVKLILESVVDAVDVPVTLKMRTGWSEERKNGPEIARIAAESGIKAIAVHGRTRESKFSGSAEYDTIAQIKKKVSIPIIANGDIDSPEKSLEVLRISGADALMIGRSSQGKPWIFRDLNIFFSDKRNAPPLEKNFVRDTILEHLNKVYQFYGNDLGARLARKHLSWYCKNLDGSETFRKKVVRAEKAREQIALVQDFFQTRA